MTAFAKRWGWGRIWSLCLVAALFAVSGCGVDWFPSQTKQATTPDRFTFTNVTGADLNATVTSNKITVSGITASSSPISISGPNGSNSEYSINSGTYTSQNGTVKNGDTVTVQHTSASTIGRTVTSTLTIGGLSGTFSTTTRDVTLSAFTGRTPEAGNLFLTSATITSLDTIPHTISISDTSNTASYEIVTSNAVQLNNFTSATQTISNINGLTLFVQKDANSTTTVTIDGFTFTVVLPAQ